MGGGGEGCGRGEERKWWEGEERECVRGRRGSVGGGGEGVWEGRRGSVGGGGEGGGRGRRGSVGGGGEGV